jgi:DNA-directed RNA polymerase subunit N (RpoN/RPB10)
MARDRRNHRRRDDYRRSNRATLDFMTRGKTNEQIFAEIGLDRDGIRRAVGGASVARPVIVRLPEEIQRPICLVCGRPVGKKTCVPVRYERPATGEHSPLPSPEPE